MKQLSSTANWESLLNDSREHPFIILKHSNTCPISAAIFERVKPYDEKNAFSLPVYLVVVQKSRDVSGKISTDLDVRHESPQVIIVKDRMAVYAKSHYDIDPEDIISALRKRS